MDLKDKVVLITGSSQGIGKETALLFAKQGANVVVTYNKNKKGGEDVFKECKKIKGALLANLDVTNDESIKNCVEKTIDKFGAIDTLVNNAGVLFNKDFVEQNANEIELQIDTNVKGLIKMTKAVLPYMQGQNSGIIINIASAAGKNAYAGLSAYCATKFAVRGFTQALAKELPKGIKIYSVNPGLTATKMTNFQGVNPKKVAEVILKAAEEKINVESGGDVDVWKYVLEQKPSDAYHGVKRRIGEMFGGNEKG
ncbi:SDR family oxidoreductase [Candidatus Pacearchaeota archaeon]|nr:SDR family oxidoreductase [Candidatus Pacearchaeota archaeon]